MHLYIFVLKTDKQYKECKKYLGGDEDLQKIRILKIEHQLGTNGAIQPKGFRTKIAVGARCHRSQLVQAGAAPVMLTLQLLETIFAP